MAINEPRTEAYYEGVQGWPSQYSFIPDGMISLNNRFFSFRNGKIWEHNIAPDGTNNTPDRCEFYDDTFDSTGLTNSNSRPAFVEFIFNESPDVIKSFKTLSYEGLGEWDADISTDQESTLSSNTGIFEEWTTAGTVDNLDWIKKEGKLHAYIRGDNGVVDLRSFTTKGLGAGSVGSDNTIAFSNRMDTSINIGDEVYFMDNTGTLTTPVYSDTPTLVGSAVSISDDRLTLTYNRTTRADGSTFDTEGVSPRDIDFIVIAKDRVSETSGLIGFFSIIRMTNVDNTSHAEIFAVESEVSRSSD